MMLKRIDFYILRRYLGTFFFMTILLAVLAAIIDFSEKVEDFTEEGGPEWTETLFNYYFTFIPFIVSMLFPLCALISVIFFTSRMAAQAEIIAMIGGGISFYRLLYPYMLGATIIAGIHYWGNHYFFPAANKIRTKFENTYIWKHNFEGPTENLHFFLSPQSELYIQSFNRKDSSGRGAVLMQYDSSRVYFTQILAAKQMRWKEDKQQWQLRDYQIHSFDGIKEQITRGKIKDTTISILFSDIVRRDNFKESMNTQELSIFIDKELGRGSSVSIPFQVERYRRTAYPFSIIILTLIGVSVAARRTRGGMGWHLVIGMTLSALYIFTLQFSTTFSTNAGFSPALGAWTPNIIFGFVALWLVLKAQK